MSESEKDDIKAKAVYRLHVAKENLACHRKKISNIAEDLDRVSKALRDPCLRIVNVDTVDQLTVGDTHYDYPSREQAISAFQELRKAEKEHTAHCGSY